jgi:hypothetical protein
MLTAVTVISSGQGLHLRQGPHDMNKRVLCEYSELYRGCGITPFKLPQQHTFLYSHFCIHYVQALVGSSSHVIIFYSNKCFGLVDKSQRRIRLLSKWETVNAMFPLSMVLSPLPQSTSKCFLTYFSYCIKKMGSCYHPVHVF